MLEFLNCRFNRCGWAADGSRMERATELDIDLFDAFLNETDPGTSRLLAELLGIPEQATAASPASAPVWDGIDRRRAA